MPVGSGSNWLVALLIIAVLLIVGLTILAVFYVTKAEVASAGRGLRRR